MTLTLEIPPEVQRELARQAEVQGIAVPAPIARLLEDATGSSAAGVPSRMQRPPAVIEAWLDSLAEFSNQIPVQPGETFSLAMIYNDYD
jgi:hypothetical protein